ncbi:hypothetical protein PPTG_24157 [Phytophthora nicotianae INRA-310]|uniref:Uncharacterized protein n=2 Tax=Phytophthora nicotianae TaxID=4792 RepID=W2PK30_PHYN3|nr:hypothetical protein PPTG_24157 [Phytophthora nicotianae INRA-310]ETN00976.1 hypothetical protein PPTG_24157 [Phytophthora nicotianae INRA-310]
MVTISRIAKNVYDEQVKRNLTKSSDEEQLIWFQGYGYATTNNPVEQFNRLIKRDYTLRAKHKIGTLFQQLADCCGHESVTLRIFKESPEVTCS